MYFFFSFDVHHCVVMRQHIIMFVHAVYKRIQCIFLTICIFYLIFLIFTQPAIISLPTILHNIYFIILSFVCNNVLYNCNNIIVYNAHVARFIMRHRPTAASYYYYDNALHEERTDRLLKDINRPWRFSNFLLVTEICIRLIPPDMWNDICIVREEYTYKLYNIICVHIYYMLSCRPTIDLHIARELLYRCTKRLIGQFVWIQQNSRHVLILNCRTYEYLYDVPQTLNEIVHNHIHETLSI